jgi:hypothetical protein
MDGRPQRPPDRWEDRPGGDLLGAGPGEQDGHGHPRPPEVVRAGARRGRRGRGREGVCVCVAAGGGAAGVSGGLSPSAGLRGGASVALGKNGVRRAALGGTEGMGNSGAFLGRGGSMSPPRDPWVWEMARECGKPW